VAIQQFLLTNLIKKADQDHLSFRVPLDIISRGIPHIGGFPYSEDDPRTFDRPTLFVKGGASPYINDRNLPLARKFFPNMELRVMEGVGHWGLCILDLDSGIAVLIETAKQCMRSDRKSLWI
jgi:hypothetical protein